MKSNLYICHIRAGGQSLDQIWLFKPNTTSTRWISGRICPIALVYLVGVVMVTSVVLESVGCVVALGTLSAPGTAGAANTAGAPDTVPVSGCKTQQKSKINEWWSGGRGEAIEYRRSHQQRGSASGCRKQQMLFVKSQQAERTGQTSLQGVKGWGAGEWRWEGRRGWRAGCRSAAAGRSPLMTLMSCSVRLYGRNMTKYTVSMSDMIVILLAD